MANWLELLTAKIKLSLDAREILQNKFLADRLVNFAVRECQLL